MRALRPPPGRRRDLRTFIRTQTRRCSHRKIFKSMSKRHLGPSRLSLLDLQDLHRVLVPAVSSALHPLRFRSSGKEPERLLPRGSTRILSWVSGVVPEPIACPGMPWGYSAGYLAAPRSQG